MRNPSALAIAAVLALAMPALAGPPKTKPATAGPKTPKTSPSVKASPAVSAPKANAAPKTHGAPKVKTTPAAAANTAKPPKGPKTTPGSAGKVKSPSPVAGATGTTTGVVPPPAMPKNPKLAAKLQSSLPMGMTVEQAALGFKNQGQFIAAVNVSRNLGIPFADLKTSIVDNKLSLGQSIHHLKPTADADAEAARAIRLANQSINQPN